MRERSKIFILILTFNFLGCNPQNCDTVPKYLDIEGLDVAVNKITKTYNDGSFSTQPFDTNNTIDFKDLVLRLTPEMNYYGQTNSFKLGNPFISSAYAGKCPTPGYQGSMEQISDIIIFSNNPFLDSGTTQDTLSQYFNISGYDRNNYIEPVDLLSFMSTQPTVMREIDLTLKVKPTGSSAHEFTIIYKQTNGEIYEVTTPTIKFK